jgi:hypothetical protein
MENGRGETIRLINTAVGTEKIDLHFNACSPAARAAACTAARNPTTSISYGAGKAP